MQSFVKFLSKSHIDDELEDVFGGDVYSIVGGNSIVKEDDDDEEYSLDDILDLNMRESLQEDDGKKRGSDGVERGFGGEEYVSLDAPQIFDNTLSEAKAPKKVDNADPKTV